MRFVARCIAVASAADARDKLHALLQANRKLRRATHNISAFRVVVSRWYGGVKLGPDRFRLINSAARETLVPGDNGGGGGGGGGKKKGKKQGAGGKRENRRQCVRGWAVI